jgi:tetratricopeptide (TPR) repeat protein
VPLVLNKGAFLPFVVADSNGASGRKLKEAFEAFRKEKYEKSADLLKETIKLFGGSPNAEAANLDLAAVYVRLGLWDNAKDRILDYLGGAKEPQRYRDLAFYLEGLMHLGRRDGEKAERAFLKVKRDAWGGPSGEEIDFRLAQAGELMKDMTKWAGYLEKAQASAKDPARKARLWHQSGQLHGKHGRPDRAVEFHRKVLDACAKGGIEEFADLCADSRLRVADIEFKRKRYKESMAEYRKFEADFPEHKEGAWAHYQMANIYQATRNLESALNEYKKVIDNYPDSYWASQAQWKREDAIWRKEYEEVLD